MKTAQNRKATRLTAVILSGLAFVGTPANAAAIDEFGNKVVLSVVESLTQDLSKETADGQKHQTPKGKRAERHSATDAQKTRGQEKAK